MARLTLRTPLGPPPSTADRRVVSGWTGGPGLPVSGTHASWAG